MNHSDPLPPSHPHLTNLALSDLTDNPCGRVTSGIREPQLTSGLRKDTQPQKSSNVKHVGACRGRRCGLHGITIPVSAIALKGLSLLSGGLIGQTHNSVMVIFPDSQQSLPASCKREVDHVMGLKSSIFPANTGAYHLQKQILHCQFCFVLIIQRVQGSGPLLYADATICLTRSKISTKVVCVHLSAVHLLVCNEKRIF